MAGQGWWVETTRFHEDPAYAKQVLSLAMSAQSSTLRELAASLLAGIEHRCDRCSDVEDPGALPDADDGPFGH